MTIAQIESFVTLASMLNYTKASSKLHTTQPNLSKIIVSIEQEVGVKLFERSKRDVRLTPAGETFLVEMEKTLEQYARSVEMTKIMGSGFLGAVTVGFLGTAVTGLLPEIVRVFNQRHPQIQLKLIDYTYSSLFEALISNQIEVALIPDRELHNIPKISKKPLSLDDMCLVVNRDHPFANRESIDLSEVSENPFVMMDPKVSLRDYELVANICLEHDFLPKVAYEANTLNTLLLMVDCGLGVSILAKHMAQFATENVRFIGIRGLEGYFKIVCAWPGVQNPCLPRFLEVIDECQKSRD